MSDTNNVPATEPASDAASGSGFLDVKRSNLVLGLAAGLGLGLLAAVLYAVVGTLTGREIGYLALLIGVAVGFGIVKFGGRKDMLTGAIAGVIAAILFLLAVMFTLAGVISDEFGIGLSDVLTELWKEPIEVLKLYFQEDAMGYLFLVLAIAPAFVMGSGIRDQK